MSVRKIIGGFSCCMLSAFLLLYLVGYSTTETVMRSAIAFFIAPLLILHANYRHLWFRKSYRWMVHLSQLIVPSAALFFIGTLVSYEVSLMVRYGFFAHLLFLSICSLIYWAPLLLQCSFTKPKSHMNRFAYFTLTSILFFIYHQMTFYFYQAKPTLGFMISGLVAMLLTLLYMMVAWSKSESHTDRISVKGYVQPIKENK